MVLEIQIPINLIETAGDIDPVCIFEFMHFVDNLQLILLQNL
jgi:hypothetical protein